MSTQSPSNRLTNIGVPKEIKTNERRAGLTPQSVADLARQGHSIFVETELGSGIGASDEDYRQSGATILDSAEEVFTSAQLIVKVKEPQASELKLLTEDHTLFTYLHLAPDPEQTKGLLESGATCIAYETVTDDSGDLPLLAPMSKVAGRMAIQAGAHSLEATQGGAGLLLGGVPGVPAAKVTVIGGGVVGSNSVEMALGMGADVTVLDRDLGVLDDLAARFGPNLRTLYSNTSTLRDAVLEADLVVGAVLIKGAKAPHLITKEMVGEMSSGSVLVDVAIDQGGCMETSRPTTHDEPTFVVDDVVHYCVANMPGGVPRTSTYALNNSTLIHVIRLANRGTQAALASDPHLANGLNIVAGQVAEPAVAEALELDYVEQAEAINLVGQ